MPYQAEQFFKWALCNAYYVEAHEYQILYGILIEG